MPRSEDAALLRESVARFTERHVAPSLATLDHHPDTEVPGAMLDALDELGLDALDPRTAHGRVLLAVAVETMARRAAAPAVLSLARVVASALATDRAPLGAGAFPLYADLPWVDPVPLCKTVEGRLVLSGRCELVVGAPMAAWLLLPVAAETGAPASHLAVVAADAPGVRVGPPLLTLGARGCPTADVTLQDAPLAPHARWALPDDTLAPFRGPVAALCAGLAVGAWETARDYAEERMQGGRPIAQHGEVHAMLARMRSDAVLCGQVASALCEHPEQLEPFGQVRQAAARATAVGVQVLGGYGYMEDYEQERRMRDARQLCSLLGHPAHLELDAGAAAELSRT